MSSRLVGDLHRPTGPRSGVVALTNTVEPALRNGVSLLADWDRIAWLDVLTTLDVAGFYLVVGRRKAVYPPMPWERGNLFNLLRTIFTLSVVNEYEVVWGFADVDGLMGLAAGADAIAADGNEPVWLRAACRG